MTDKPTAPEATTAAAREIVSGAKIENYNAYLQDKYRPPSKGGNTKAWHGHVITINGEEYSFRALGSKRWIFAGDTVSFEWSWDVTKKYRNIDSATIQTWDKSGDSVVRGVRGTKKWRTAGSRLPSRD